VQHTGDLRRTLPSGPSTAILVPLFPKLRSMGRLCWHRVLVKLWQQRSDPLEQRISAQENGRRIGEHGMGRTVEKRR
jgi:hypothetical protein